MSGVPAKPRFNGNVTWRRICNGGNHSHSLREGGSAAVVTKSSLGWKRHGHYTICSGVLGLFFIYSGTGGMQSSDFVCYLSLASTSSTGWYTILNLLWTVSHGLVAVKFIQHVLKTFPACQVLNSNIDLKVVVLSDLHYHGSSYTYQGESEVENS
ncbi:hypothetical protein L2E82_48715 [Cichorium intybus]|uniref:Uncharacterized protein n=1 Tax=Cichorium intybus TaxID=13427 RepID=A0ACB8YYT2_CICIN|nr:hypothetical protein L2E82_48715 [Cichorium intybus]